MEQSFGQWLDLQLQERHITQSEFASMIGVYPSQISRIISGQRNPTNEMLIKMADALRIPREEIFQVAGLIPLATEAEKLKKQILYEVNDMSEQDQQEVLAFIRMKNNLRNQRKGK